MATVFVFQTGQTLWQAQSRVEPSAGAPLSEEGARQVEQARAELPDLRIPTVYSGGGQAERQTAEMLAGVLKAKVREDKNLREVDYGLWQGLTLEEIARRQPRVYKRWEEDPVQVRPPGGETLEEARERVANALHQILKRRKSPVMLVLRPVAAELARRTLSGRDLDDFWNGGRAGCAWSRFEVNANGDSA